MLANNQLWPSLIAEARPLKHALVITTPSTPPGCPTPGVGIGRETIAFLKTCFLRQKTVARNRSHSLIKSVASQQLFTVPEKILIRQNVILKYNSFFHLSEEPINCLLYTCAAAQVDGAKACLNLTRPINLLSNNTPDSRTANRISLMALTRTICPSFT